jgi:hypothetical protein
MTSLGTAPAAAATGSIAPGRDRSRRRTRYLWLALLVLPIGCGIAAVAIGQPLDSDTLLYHYYDAWAFLHGRELIDIFPANYQTLLNPLEDVPFFLLDTHLAPTIAAFVIGFWQGLGPAIVAAIAWRLTRSGYLAAAVGITAAVAGGFASELGSLMGDSTVAPFFLAGVYLAVRQLHPDRRARPAPTARRPWRSPWLASGLCFGLGAGLKFAEAPMAVAGVLAILATGRDWRRTVPAALISLAGLLLGAGLTAGYWTEFLWTHYHDPFAFTGGTFLGFTSPFNSLNSGPWHGPTSLAQATYFPVYWFFHATAVVGISLREASLPIAYLLVLALLAITVVRVGVALRPRATAETRPLATPTDADGRAAADRYVVALFVITLAVWVKVFAVYRYLIPLELLSPAVIVAVGRRIAGAWAKVAPRLTVSPAIALGAFTAICLICVISQSPGNYWLRIGYGPAEFHVVTPAMLRNGRLDLVVEENADWLIVNSNPSAFVLPELDARFIAVGDAGATVSPAQLPLDQRAYREVERAGGDVVGYWISTPPTTNQVAYLDALGLPGLRSEGCVEEHLDVGAGYEPIGFCRYGPGRT